MTEPTISTPAPQPPVVNQYFAQAASEVAKAAIKSRRGAEAPAASMRPPKFTQENVIAGKNLNNYIDREPDENGQYVVVVTHTEHIELIEQPLTAEEKAELKAEKEAERKFTLKILTGLGLGVAGLFGFLAYTDKTNRTLEVTPPAVETKPKSR